MYGLLRRLLFLLDAEAAHELVTSAMKRFQALPGGTDLLGRVAGAEPRGLARTLWGLRFPNPVGIAAGFDKNGELVPFLRALGFGFVEVGTVTLHPQPGNPRPRMFRYPERKAVVNRLGFNNEGSAVMAATLRELHERAEPWVPLFVNIGKNREVPLDRASEDYAACYRRVGPLADGVVVNVSSPNTTSLRELQRPESLAAIVRRLHDERARAEFARPGEHPILVKIAPDLEPGQIDEIAEVCGQHADGMVATNTTVDHRALQGARDEAGGLSGEPLFELANAVLRRLRACLGPGYPLVGVGGVGSPAQAVAKMDAGADLIQAYTGFIYGGPSFPGRLVRALGGAGR